VQCVHSLFALWAFFGVALTQDLPVLDENFVIENIGALSTAIYGQFAFVQQQMSWSDANQHCFDNYGTTLATLENDIDAEAVLALKNMFQGDDTSHVWIGLPDTDGACASRCTASTVEWQHSDSSIRHHVEFQRNIDEFTSLGGATERVSECMEMAIGRRFES